MLLLALVGLCAHTVPLAGGSLSALADVRLRGSWILVLALGVQVVIISILPGGSETLHRVLHLSTYAGAAVFLFANRRIRGLGVVAAGGAANAVAIAANGGVMPASASAMSAAGLHASSAFVNSGAVVHARLSFLGDILAVPSWMPLHNVYSIGDVIIVAGAAIALHSICGSRLAQRPPVPSGYDASSASAS